MRESGRRFEQAAEERVRTNTVHGANLLYILDPCPRLDLDHGEESLVRGEHVLGRGEAVSDGREGRTLASKALRGELAVSDDLLGLGGVVDLRNHDTTDASERWRLSQHAVLGTKEGKGDKLGSRVEGTLQDVGRSSSDTDDRADPLTANCCDRVVHLVVSNVPVLAVDDDGLAKMEAERASQLSFGWSKIRRAAYVEAGERDNLCMTDGGDGHEGHQRVLASFELVEQAKARVRDNGRVGGREGRHGDRSKGAMGGWDEGY